MTDARCGYSRTTASRWTRNHGQGQGRQVAEARSKAEAGAEAAAAAEGAEERSQEGSARSQGRGPENPRAAGPAGDPLSRESGARPDAEIRLQDRDAGAAH